MYSLLAFGQLYPHSLRSQGLMRMVRTSVFQSMPYQRQARFHRAPEESPVLKAEFIELSGCSDLDIARQHCTDTGTIGAADRISCILSYFVVEVRETSLDQATFCTHKAV